MRKLLIFIIGISIVLGVAAQSKRRVTPVTENTNKVLPSSVKKPKKDPKVTIVSGEFKKDTIVGDTLFMLPDSLRPHMKYPKLNGVIIGANIWDPLMRLCGQSYGGMDFSAELSLWNRIFPVVEAGVGFAKATPEDMNYTYKCKVSPYFKVGANYNFLYNKDQKYQIFAGLRLGYSTFNYDVTDIAINSGYWGETDKVEILNQKSNALWGEILLGIRVNLIGNLSMGWSFKYHNMFKCKKNYNSDPWYIPGYGSRTGSITGGLSVYYTLPLNKRKVKKDKDAYTGEPLSSPENSGKSEKTLSEPEEKTNGNN